jgi:hypothetical protein
MNLCRLGPVDLTSGTTTSGLKVPTIADNLHTQGAITTESIGIYFAPTTSKSITNGELTFGGIDSSKITSSVKYVPLTTTNPASAYWGIEQSVTYGTTSILRSTAGIVDTGTTLILLASGESGFPRLRLGHTPIDWTRLTEAYNAYKTATGATYDSITSLLEITPTKYNALKNLDFIIGGTSHTLTPNAQIWPRALNTFIGGSPDKIYLVIADVSLIFLESLGCLYKKYDASWLIDAVLI